jgi:hypothetical protein
MENKENLISYCGVNCGACPSYLKGKCKGCRGNTPDFSVGLPSCKMKSCCVENGYTTCANCTKHESVDDCKIFNPLFFRFGEFIAGISRKKGLEMIKKEGIGFFAEFMAENKLRAMKRSEK